MRIKTGYLSLIVACLLAVSTSACGGSSEPEIVVNDDNGRSYNPLIEAANFVRTIDNPFLSLTPGKTWVYEGTGENGLSLRSEFEVTRDTKTILGVTTTVVRDRSWLNGNLSEDTLDWYAQDREGNVWYFGEDSKEIKNGKVASTEGSWEAGVKGAKAGIIMKGQPHVGDTYRQEYLKGEAEDVAELLGINESVTIRLGSYSKCVLIKEWVPNEKAIVEEKHYCQEAGNLVKSKKVAGESGQAELVEVKAAR